MSRAQGTLAWRGCTGRLPTWVSRPDSSQSAVLILRGRFSTLGFCRGTLSLGCHASVSEPSKGVQI